MSLIHRADYPIHLHPPFRQPVNAWLDRAHARLAGLYATWRARREFAREMRLLAQFDSRELQDIGITRSDLMAVAAGFTRRD